MITRILSAKDFLSGEKIRKLTNPDTFLSLTRFIRTKDTTVGKLILYQKGKPVFACFTIEDTKRDKKVKGKTRIPAGEYFVGLRKAGKFYERYRKKYPVMENGVMALYNQPNWILENNGMKFQYILIHGGNTSKDTQGCILPNYSVDLETFTGSKSMKALVKLYELTYRYILENGHMRIKIQDKDFELKND